MTNDPENNDDLKESLKAYGLKQDIARIHNEMMPSLGKRTPVRSLFSYANRIAAAILILLVSTGIVVYVISTPSALFKSSYEPYRESAQRGNVTTASETKNRFMEGQKMLQEGNADKAINIFDEIISRNAHATDKTLNDDAEYYLALAYLKANKPGNALIILRRIYSNKEHLYNDKVSDWFMLRAKIAAWKEK